MQLNRQQIERFQEKIGDFYKKNRRDLPWRNTINPYYIVVSELMLQQTQVPRVIEKYHEFLKKFPTFQNLSNALTADVLAAWQGLGYNRRALYLKGIADKIVKEFDNVLPDDPTILQTFKGLGHATARSIVIFTYNKPEVFIETNIRRVFIHEFFSNQNKPLTLTLSAKGRGNPFSPSPSLQPRLTRTGEGGKLLEKKISDSQLYPLIEQTLDKTNPREWYYALMDYGSIISKTTQNPNRKSRHYTKQSKFEGSFRQVRGTILKILLKEKVLSVEKLHQSINTPSEYFQTALTQLANEGFLVVTKKQVKIK